jgi:hypothetical protein
MTYSAAMRLRNPSASGFPYTCPRCYGEQKAERSVSGHKFKIGQLVYYLGRERASGVYQITQLLPPEGGAFQYRIKNTNEPHEHMAKEHELRGA